MSGDFGVLVGQTIAQIDGATIGSERIRFRLADGRVFVMRHQQDCCEDVQVEDVIGDVSDLIGATVVKAEERTNKDGVAPIGAKDRYYESATWTFYEIATNKGSVTIRWLGTSNGYYSEEVDFSEVA